MNNDEERPQCHWCGESTERNDLRQDDYLFCSEKCLDEYGEDCEIEDLKRFVYGV